MHRVLLRFFSPVVFSRLQKLDLGAEIYAWDWFAQLFMGIFPFEQCLAILDLLISTKDDMLLICLSVAIVDELRPILLKVGIYWLPDLEQFRKNDDHL